MPQIFLDCIAIIIGASAGALLRYFAVLALPFPIFIVNIVGSFLIGLAYQKFSNSTPPHHLHLVNTGFLGGLTTFSAFSLELLQGCKSGKFLEMGIYAVISVVACLIACFIGYKLKLF